MGFLGVTRGSRSSPNTWNGWVDENVEIVIFYECLCFYLDLTKTCTK